MSRARREQLADEIMATQPALQAFVRKSPGDLIAGSWEYLAYSFERGFEAMWDQAKADHTGLLLRPLLMLWRQSVELHIKAAITFIHDTLGPNSKHDLAKLFDQLLAARAALGWDDDNDYARKVRNMVILVQSFDPFADRFRYPTTRAGQPFEGIDADLDQLFQAHWIITTWCEGSSLEYEAQFIL